MISEVQIEVTSYCNADCPFCINRATFAADGRSSKGLAKEVLLEVLERLRVAGINRVRFTGGEPLLRKDLFQIVEHAKTQGFTVGLNTNGFLVEKYRDQINELVDFVLISIVSTSQERTDSVMATPSSFAKKCLALKFLKDHPNLWTSTVLCEHSIYELEKLYLFMKAYGVTHWILLRPEDNFSVNSEYNFTKGNLDQLILKAHYIRNRYGETIALGNSIPICADPTGIISDMMRRGRGATASEGRSKIVIDPNGRVLAHYGINVELGTVFGNFADLWNHPFALKLRSLESSPPVCQNCNCYEFCRGGSRLAARAANGDLFTSDPLMNAALETSNGGSECAM